MNFYPAPFRAPLRAFASLVFPWLDNKVLVCDISRRGWCIPSGRVEPYETSLEAALREAREEGGAELEDCQYIGCYQIRERNETRWADCYVAKIASLGEISMPQESKGRQLVPLAELAKIYHLWTPLTEAVFKHSLEVMRRAGE